MRRVLESLKWHAAQWDLRGRYHSRGASLELREGILAYAAEQGALQRTFAAKFKVLWKTPLADVDNLFGQGTMTLEGAESDDEHCNSDDEAPDDTSLD